MAAEGLSSDISLHGAPETEDPKPGFASTILLKLNGDTLRDLRKASQENDSLHFVTGKTPKLRIGSRSIDLTISPDAFRTELFASSVGLSSSDFTFTSVVSHRAESHAPNQKSSGETTGADAALAVLQSSLASYEQEKQANQANITNSILPAPKNRFDAARKEKLARKRGISDTKSGLQSGSPSMSAVGTPNLGAIPISAAASEDDLRMSAMRKPLVHLLAMKPTTGEEIVKKTHIPKSDLDAILQKVGKLENGKWQLTDRTYKELDVWKFEYPSQEDRQAAVDNAVRAYDRMRLGREDKLWQMLLPKEARDRGKVLSKLHFGGGQVNRGLTPNYQPSPMPHVNGSNDSRAPSAANTPRLGSSTPRPGSSKGDVMKRLLSKDPKKARAQEEAKGKKRKEREAAASDNENGRPAKKQQTKKTDTNVKSAEFVHSSEEEESSDEIPMNQVTAQPKSKSEKPKGPSKSKVTVTSSNSSDSSDTAIKTKIAEKTAAKAKHNSPPAKGTASPAVKPPKSAPVSKSTPQANKSNNLSAPSSQQKSQRSPQNPDSRPRVPSPLGAARPRVASDVSDRGAVGVQKIRQGGSETPKGLGITNGVRKRQDTVTSTHSATEKDHSPPNKAEQPTVNGTEMAKSKKADGISHKTSNGVKRKAEYQSSPPAEGTTNIKHRKTESTSSASQKPHPNPHTAAASTPRTSLEGPLEGTSGSDSAGSVIETITYSQGVKLAEKFETYYPKYAKLYDEQEAMGAKGEKVSPEERDRLLQMHARLAQMKREIQMAAQREGED